MITLLTGENSFELDRELERIVAAFDGTAETFDGETLEPRQLPDVLMGATLFASKRLVIIKGLSANKAVWPTFDEWLVRVSDDIHLVLVDPKIDKRSKVYKVLTKLADIKTFALWGERDTGLAEKWAIDEAKQLGLKLTPALARQLIQRTGVDQWSARHALEKLSLLGEVTAEHINELVEPNPTENVFGLFELALKGQSAKVHDMIQTLSLTEDVYKTMGLLSSQALQLALLASTDKSSADVAKENGVHPFVLQKLSPYARKLGQAGARQVIEIMAITDMDMKSTGTDPWILMERALLKIANI